jgi:hypothetical protein
MRVRGQNRVITTMALLLIAAGVLGVLGVRSTAARTAVDDPGTAQISERPTGLLSPAHEQIERVVRTIEVKPSPRPAPKPSAPSNTAGVVLRPVTAFFNQATVDRGRLVTWATSPTCILAGHDSMGWAWLDNVATGRTVTVATGPCAGHYVVYGHRHQRQKGGPIPGWMSDPGLDLVLQTCTGSSGMGFALARKL